MGVASLLIPGSELITGPSRLAGIPLGLGGAFLTVGGSKQFQRAETNIKSLDFTVALAGRAVGLETTTPRLVGCSPSFDDDHHHRFGATQRLNDLDGDSIRSGLQFEQRLDRCLLSSVRSREPVPSRPLEDEVVVIRIKRRHRVTGHPGVQASRVADRIVSEWAETGLHRPTDVGVNETVVDAVPVATGSHDVLIGHLVEVVRHPLGTGPGILGDVGHLRVSGNIDSLPKARFLPLKSAGLVLFSDDWARHDDPMIATQMRRDQGTSTTLPDRTADLVRPLTAILVDECDDTDVRRVLDHLTVGDGSVIIVVTRHRPPTPLVAIGSGMECAAMCSSWMRDYERQTAITARRVKDLTSALRAMGPGSVSTMDSFPASRLFRGSVRCEIDGVTRTLHAIDPDRIVIDPSHHLKDEIEAAVSAPRQSSGFRRSGRLIGAAQ